MASLRPAPFQGRRWVVGTAVRVAASAALRPRLAERDRRRDATGDLSLQAPIGEQRPVEADDGTVLHVRVLNGSSSGPTFVLTHGLCCDHRVWHPISRRLAAAGRVVLWDLRGHGRSTAADDDDLTPAQHARDLAAVIDQQVVGPVMLLGHSLGGMTSIRYLLDAEPNASRVAASVLIATPTADIVMSALSGRGTSRLEAAAGRRLIRALLGNDRLDRRFVSGETGSTRDRGYSLIRATGFGHHPVAAQVALVHEMIAATAVDVRRRCFEGMTATDLRRAARGIDVPTLVVIGARDRLVNPHQSRQLAHALPDGHALTFRNAGHAVVLERASHIASRTLRLAEQVLAGRVDLAAVAAG